MKAVKKMWKDCLKNPETCPNIEDERVKNSVEYLIHRFEERRNKYTIQTYVFNKLLKGLAGKKVWDIRAGPSTGSIFSFEIGEAQKVESHKGIEQEGEFLIMVYCSWRIEHIEHKVILGSWKDKYLFSLENLKDEIIKDIYLTDFYDTYIQFERGKRLVLFADQSKNDGFDTNWFLVQAKNKKYYSLTNQYVIEVESFLNVGKK